MNILFIVLPSLAFNNSKVNRSVSHVNSYSFSKYKNIYCPNKKNSKSRKSNTKALLGPSGGFLGVGSSEVLVIGVVAWLILGPKRLYQLARDIGRISAEFKNVTDEARLTFQKAVEIDEKDSKEVEKATDSKKTKDPIDFSESKLASLNRIIDSEISNFEEKK